MVTVKINRYQLDYFRKKARDTEKEIFALLIGTVVNSTTVIVDRIEYPKIEASTAAWITPDSGHCEQIRRDAFDVENVNIVGTIHSHPNWWPVLSPTDHKSHLVDGHRISGVCTSMNRKTKVYFWVSESSLPCTIKYTNNV